MKSVDKNLLKSVEMSRFGFPERMMGLSRRMRPCERPTLAFPVEPEDDLPRTPFVEVGTHDNTIWDTIISARDVFLNFRDEKMFFITT